MRRTTSVYSIHEPTIWNRLSERLAEPLPILALSGLAALFGSYRTKTNFDLVKRRHYAYAVLEAADQAKAGGFPSVTVAEFGVASGKGLLNLCKIARKVSSIVGIDVEVVGLDTGAGMPPPRDYRDHPDLYQTGDFPMDQRQLTEALPRSARLLIGEVKDTVPQFVRTLTSSSPLGFAAIDIDYYSSAKDVLQVFAHPDSTKYLPLTLVYLDDINQPSHSRYTGELLAVEEFNATHAMRKIDAYRFLKFSRMVKHARWHEQMFLLHVFDHPAMCVRTERRPTKVYPSIARG